MIVFEAITKSFGGRPVVREFSLVIEPGERVILLGPSGSGKTTVLRLMAGLTAPDAGRILLDGVTASEPGRIIVPAEERNLGFVFHDLALWPHMTVHGNLEFGLKARGIPKSDRSRRIAEMLELVHLGSRAGSRPGELSGGEQQRVALARALVLQPRALLMDEPLANLNPELKSELCSEILRLHAELRFTLLHVTHSRDEAMVLGTRLVSLSAGRVLA